jgi:sulfur-oxidizing protein SoxX
VAVVCLLIGRGPVGVHRDGYDLANCCAASEQAAFRETQNKLRWTTLNRLEQRYPLGRFLMSSALLARLRQRVYTAYEKILSIVMSMEVPMRRLFGFMLVAAVIGLVPACELGQEWRSGIHLPAGDATRGEALFASLGCISCHAVGNAEFSGTAQTGPVRVRLGSKAGRRMSYGQLVTSIVNPSHRLAPQYFSDNISENGESLMANYNDALTVTQLTDLVAYLQTHYEDVLRPGFQYPAYTYGKQE